MTPDTQQTQFVRFIAEALCDDKDAIEVVETTDEQGIIIRLYVSPSDLGRMIGKKGATATAMRNLLRGLGSKNGARYSFKVDKRDAA
jgi:predicted RNA-binding protein YlqC (UPF0109 family)